MSKKCKYCKDEKEHAISKTERTIAIYISKGYISTFCDWCGAYKEVKIRYCPMCGRDMEADND